MRLAKASLLLLGIASGGACADLGGIAGGHELPNAASPDGEAGSLPEDGSFRQDASTDATLDTDATREATTDADAPTDTSRDVSEPETGADAADATDTSVIVPDGGCLVPSDCGGSDTECSQSICSNHVCGVALTPRFTPTALQLAGDCKKRVCNGIGATMTMNDDTDVPEDKNTCTADMCNNGNPEHTPLLAQLCERPNDAGTGMCNAAGDCM